MNRDSNESKIHVKKIMAMSLMIILISVFALYSCADNDTDPDPSMAAAKHPRITDEYKIDMDGKVYISYDGGISYIATPVKIEIDPAQIDLWSEYCAIYNDLQTVSIAVYVNLNKLANGDNSADVKTIIYTSADFGKTWASMEISNFYPLFDYPAVFSFTSPKNGWYAFTYASAMHSGRSQVYKTTDSGVNWQLVGYWGSSLYEGFISDMSAIDENTCFISYYQPVPVEASMPLVFDVTFDGGITWKLITLELPPEYNDYFSVGLSPIYDDGNTLLYPVKLLKSDFNANYRIDNYNDGIVYFQSTDGGHTWTFVG